MRNAALGLGTLVAVSVTGQVSAQQLVQPPAPPTCSEKQLASVINRNHGHSFLISLADLKKNGVKSYDIKGATGHSHLVDVTADVLLALFLNGAVEIESTKEVGHTHIVRLEIV